jgi:hypothetical protein
VLFGTFQHISGLQCRQTDGTFKYVKYQIDLHLHGAIFDDDDFFGIDVVFFRLNAGY